MPLASDCLRRPLYEYSIWSFKTFFNAPRAKMAVLMYLRWGTGMHGAHQNATTVAWHFIQIGYIHLYPSWNSTGTGAIWKVYKERNDKIVRRRKTCIISQALAAFNSIMQNGIIFCPRKSRAPQLTSVCFALALVLFLIICKNLMKIFKRNKFRYLDHSLHGLWITWVSRNSAGKDYFNFFQFYFLCTLELLCYLICFFPYLRNESQRSRAKFCVYWFRGSLFPKESLLCAIYILLLIIFTEDFVLSQVTS